MIRPFLLATALALATGPVLAQSSASTGAPAPVPMRMAQATMAMPNPDYVAKTSEINTAEVDLAKLAEKKSANAAVKAFAAMMIKDHGAAEAKLTTIVSGEPGMTMPKPMVAPADAATMKKLEAASGAAFDKMYVAAQIEGHEAALKIQKAYAATGSDAKLKAFAADMVKAVSMHLEHAQMLGKEIGA